MSRKRRPAHTKTEPASLPAGISAPSAQETIEDALRHHRAGELAEAERLYQTVLAVESRHADALYLLGVIARQSGRDGQAVELIGNAIAVKPTVAHYYATLGNTLRTLGRLSDAVTALDTAARLKPDHAETHADLGNALFDLGRLSDAVGAYTAALRVMPDSAETQYNLGNALFGLRRFGEAIAAFDSAIRVKPDFAEAHCNRGNTLFDLGRLPEAVVAFNAAIHIKPDFAEAHSNRGNALRRLDRPSDAVAAFDTAIRLKPDFAEAHSNRGNVLKDLGRLHEAVTAFNTAIDLKPNYAEAHSNLGNALKTLGRLGEAIAAFNTAIRFKPSSAELRSNLGIALKDLGRLYEAIAAFDTAIHLRPDFAEAHSNRGNALKDLGRVDEAIAAYQTAIRFKPNYAEAHYNLGNALKEMRRLSEAVAAYEAAIRINPDYAEAHSNLGVALSELGRLDEALAQYDKAASLLVPGFESPLVNKALLLMEMGKLEDSRDAIGQALALKPRSAEAWHTLGSLKTFSPGDPDLETMDTWLTAAETRTDRMLFRFALGKAWMDAGDSDRAFAHFAEGNRLNRATFAYDSDATDRWMADIAERFTPDMMKRMAHAGDPSEIPVFIVGMPRSGTTLIEQILASHPEIHGAGELSLVNDMVERLSGSAAIFSPEDLAKLGSDYVASVTALAPGRSRVVDKMPTNFLHAGLIHLMMPNARIIHVRRDPVDTCLSCYTKRFVGPFDFAYDLQELGHYYRGYQALTDHWRAVLPPERFTEVRYEDIVDDMAGEARRLIAFCGLDWDPACLDFHTTQRQVRTASAPQVRQPIYRGSVGRWKPYAPHLAPLLSALNSPSDWFFRDPQ